ncbi:hypothetical protein B30_09013 [Celeribacter baekdonensis B30]|uniref:Secreted protein n=1 Tax=Celeribacter baekdonensis B30 TaxID=1208323 RepID=K2JAM5_9RHOB|nr:hypothetical protein B30_09013 [Celeribacter baekdonensis B30]
MALRACAFVRLVFFTASAVARSITLNHGGSHTFSPLARQVWQALFFPKRLRRASVKSLRVVIDGSLAHHSQTCPIAVTSIPAFASRDRTDNGLFIWPEMSGNEADERCL